MKIKSGGGIQSNKYVTSQSGQKVEPKPKAVNVEAVANLGRAVQYKKPDLVEGPGYSGSAMAPTGSRGTYNAATSGPGSLRTTYKAGTQQANPEARDLPVGKKTF
jgi:hypothetical protein